MLGVVEGHGVSRVMGLSKEPSITNYFIATVSFFHQILQDQRRDSNRRILKTVRSVVWEGAGTQSPVPDPIVTGESPVPHWLLSTVYYLLSTNFRLLSDRDVIVSGTKFL